MIGNIPSGTYSAKVEIELIVDGVRFSVAQVGGGRIYFDRLVTLPSSAGELLLTIDGRKQRWKVALRPGLLPASIIEAEFEELL